MRRPLPLMIVLSAVLWHAWSVLAPAWVTVSEKPGNTRDFSSFYYAVQVASDGGDPYDRAALEASASASGKDRSVHPYFYPPPFLLAMSWVQSLDLRVAYKLWFWLDELALIAAALVLWRWWRPLGPMVGPVIAVSIAMLTAAPNNHIMGQMNFPALALALSGLWLEEEDRPWLGGALMGAACMWKMSPALLVAWWLLHRRWRAVGSACLCAVLLTVAALPLVGWEHQWRFYTEVLPAFSTGDYNGLTVSIGLFGNHSLPNLWHQAFPGTGEALSASARTLSSLGTLGLLGLLGVLFKHRPEDRLARVCQVGAVGVAMLLIPVYTYEHHLVWAWPAAVALVVAFGTGRLPRGWAVPLGFALTVWCFSLANLKQLWTPEGSPLVVGSVQEIKFVALLIFLSGCAWVGRWR